MELHKTRNVQEEQDFAKVLDGYHPEWKTVMSQQQIARFRHFYVASLIQRDQKEEKIKITGDDQIGSIHIFKNSVEGSKEETAVGYFDWMKAAGLQSLSQYLGIDVRLPKGPRLIRELAHKFPTEVRTNLSCTEAYLVDAESHHTQTYTIGFTHERSSKEDVFFWIALDGVMICTGATPAECLELLAVARNKNK